MLEGCWPGLMGTLPAVLLSPPQAHRPCIVKVGYLLLCTGGLVLEAPARTLLEVA